MLFLIAGCATQEADQSESRWKRPQGVTDEAFNRDVEACRAVGIAAAPKGFNPFPNTGDPEQQWAMLQQDPMSYRSLLKYENCMQKKGYTLEDDGMHLKDFLKSQ